MAISPDTDTTPRVSQLATSIQRALRDVGSGWVEGEVQRRKTVGGHTYFTLADENAAVDCCVWRSRAARIRKWPADGALVQVHFEKVDFYGRRGTVSLHVDAIRLTGEGELLARKQATLAKLTAEGLVARARRPLPFAPRRVGVIAARDSDAKTDVIEALRERWPSVQIVHRAALVEGIRAVDSVIGALAHLQGIDGLDVIVLARGGGGVRDLVAFDDERLCRAVFACAVPVVTSIGHTAQRPNCDHVAAAYAAVPARTAELVVPSAADLTAELDRHRIVLAGVTAALGEHREHVAVLWLRARPEQGLQRRALELDGLGSRLAQVVTSFYSDRERVLDGARHHLARVRLRMPAPADVDVLAARLGPAFARTRRRREDYERAFKRMRDQSGRTFARRLREHEREVSDAADALTANAGQRLGEARQRLGHVVELIAAKDFRRAGWLLAADVTGQPARSVGALAAGAELRLHFHDGVADAAVTRIHQQEGEGHG